MKRAQIEITGVVQGVSYRVSALHKARELGLTGWVRNTSNGAVVAEAEGKSGNVEQFITWCYRGPEAAIVTGIEITYLPLAGDADFMILG